MGTSVGLNPLTGRWVLDCGQCGIADGTVRKRPCPFTTDDGLPYCPASQLCPRCYRAAKDNGDWARWHADCPEGVRRSNEERRQRRDEPHLFARAAWGDWHESVPAGQVKVLTHADTVVFLPKEQYKPSIRGFGTL